MDANRFTDRLRAGRSAGRYVCVGLDPDRAQLLATTRSGGLADRIAQFGREIVDATCDLVVAYKPNSAFYEQFGPPGMGALQDLIGYIHRVAHGVVVILDAKRGDIEHTNEAYASALFDVYDADAVTVQPYLGGDALAPYLNRLDRGVIVLCRTSNPGGGELQDLVAGRTPLYQHVAELAETRWNRNERGPGPCAEPAAAHRGRRQAARLCPGSSPSGDVPRRRRHRQLVPRGDPCFQRARFRRGCSPGHSYAARAADGVAIGMTRPPAPGGAPA
jgi:orotidine 5'-phosphate decarboxylase subfamily 2